mmetsp:Transcript_17404/g.29522  ORF Transcript_17404/g.29522 Transcript_17404/m.29522 type:complete len:299 (-) Transcript_17404:491-1387(-)
MDDNGTRARQMRAQYYSPSQMMEFLGDLDIVVLAVPMVELEEVVQLLPVSRLRGKLVVEVCPLNTYPKSVLERHFGNDEVDILSSHPMLSLNMHDANDVGSSSSYTSLKNWEGRPVVYEKVRITDDLRLRSYLRVFEEARCQLVEMPAEEHDESTADSAFVTELTARLLDRHMLPPTPVMYREYAGLCDVTDTTSEDSFELFFGMYKYNPRARKYLNQMRDNLALVERQLASKEAYLSARMELKTHRNQDLVEKTAELLKDVLKKTDLLSTDHGQHYIADEDSPIVTTSQGNETSTTE